LSQSNLELDNGSVTAPSICADAFVGDGSKVTGVTAEWDGTRSGDAEITGTLTAGTLCADSIIYVYNGIYYSVEQQITMLKTATGNLNAAITSNDADITLLNVSANTAAIDITSLKTATGNIIAGSEHFTSINGAILSGASNSVGAGCQNSSVVGGWGGSVGSSGVSQNSTVLGGYYNNIKAGHRSAILSGRWNTLSGNQSAILGGEGCDITHDYAYAMGYYVDSVSSNTTHVEQLYAKSLPYTDPGIDGMLYKRTGSQLGMSGTVHCLSSTFVMVSKG
jgi:hypothetical protein